jgi:hypothetical protein
MSYSVFWDMHYFVFVFFYSVFLSCYTVCSCVTLGREGVPSAGVSLLLYSTHRGPARVRYAQ